MNLIVGQISRSAAFLFRFLAHCRPVFHLCPPPPPYPVPDNEHTFLDMEEKLIKYFPKEWKQDSGKVRSYFLTNICKDNL